NGIVNVSAKNVATGKANSITIQSGSGLSDKDIERMVKEAEENAEADRLKKEEADLRNEADQMIFLTNKAIKDLGDKVSQKEKEDAEKLIKDLEKALKGDDLDRIRKAKEELEKSTQALSQRVYEEAAKNNPNQGGDDDSGNSSQDGDQVFDADYKEV
ncbi:MAG: Hsp70 family protein, partial [Gammaproteobacteria bacterium]|nr:Hsp70 family protein [Gammaproteobacteria bacterium]